MDDIEWNVINSHEFQDLMAKRYSDYSSLKPETRRFLCEKTIEHHFNEIKKALPETFKRAEKVGKKENAFSLFINYGTVIEKMNADHFLMQENFLGGEGFDIFINIKEGYVPQKGDRLMKRTHYMTDKEYGSIERNDILLYQDGIYEPVAINYYSLESENTKKSSLELTEKILNGNIKEAAAQLKEEINFPSKMEKTAPQKNNSATKTDFGGINR